MARTKDQIAINTALSRAGVTIVDGQFALNGITAQLPLIQGFIQPQLPASLRAAASTYIAEQLAALLLPEAPMEATDDAKNGSHLKDCLHEILQHQSIEANEGGKFFRLMSQGSQEEIDFSEVSEEVKQVVRRMKTANQTKFSPDDVAGELPLYIAYCHEQKLSGLRDRLKYQVDCAPQLRGILTRWHTLFAIEQPVDVWIMMMCHWMWLVKRRVYGYSTCYEIFISLFGNQGTGKSTVLSRMVGSIFEGYYDATITLDRLVDERNRLVLRSNFVLNMEEMSNGGDSSNKMQDSSIATLKMLTTSSTATYRPLYTNKSQTIQIKASFICSCNYHLYDIIQDPTGMRRFYEFTSTQPRGESVHISHGQETLNELYAEALTMWQGVDESLERGYFDPISTEAQYVKADQEKYIKYDSFTTWLMLTHDVTPAGAPKSSWLPIKALNLEYQAYCKEHSIRMPVQYQTLASKVGQAFGVQLVDNTPGLPTRVGLVRKADAPKQSYGTNTPPGFDGPLAPNRPALSFADIIAKGTPASMPTSGF